jgi:integral membrane protein (TIGR00529 family)
MLATIPFLFGLLPIPGGALLSAPMIDVQGKKLQVSGEGRTFINLWFRHIGFLVFPLSTALVVMSQVSEIHITRLIVNQIPIFLVAILVGGVYILHLSIKSRQEAAAQKDRSTILLETAINSAPLVITILLTFSLSVVMEINMAFLIALPTGILLSLLLYRRGDRRTLLNKGFSPGLAVAVFGIMLYRDMAYASGVTEVVADYLQQTAVPALIIIPLLSFVIGMLTAHNMAAIPLLYSMLGPLIGEDVHLVSLLYISSFMGYLISPLHLCVVVSYDYFKPRFGTLYKLMLPPAILVTLVAVLLSL